MTSKEREIQELRERVHTLEEQLAEAQAIIQARTAEEELRAARDEAAWLARLPGENPNPVLRVSNEGQVLYCNPAAASLASWSCAADEPLPPPLRFLVQQAIAQEQFIKQDVLLNGKYYLVSVMPIPGQGYANVYGNDITDRKQAEQALIESERRQREVARLLELDQARLAAILRYLPVGVWIADPTGRLIGSNEQADRIWAGAAPLLNTTDEYDQYAAWDAQSGKRLQPEEYPLAVALRSGQAVEPVKLEIRRFDGSHGTVLASAAPIRDGQGVLTGAVAVNVDITEQTRARAALEESRSRTNDILRSLSDGLFALNREWAIIYINQKAAQIAGRPAEELVGRNIWALWPELRGTPLESFYRQAMELGVAGQLRVQGNQSGRWYDLSVYPSSEGITIFYVDKTDQIRAEQALRESEQRYRGLFEAMQEGLVAAEVMTDAQGNPIDYRYLDVNPAIERQFGIPREQFIGQTFTEVLPEADPQWIEILGRVALTGEPITVERYGKVTDRWFECHVYSPRPRQFVNIMTDVTQRKKAEEALRESEARFHSLADSMPQLVWTALPDGTVDYYNQRYREYREITQVQLAAWEWAPVLHPEDLASTVAAWQHSVQTGEVYQIEHRVRMADGSYRWHLSRGVPVRGGTGAIIRWYGTATDIHDLKLAEERLERSNRELEQFAFMASHDLQEPLRKIQVFGDLLAERGACLEDRERNYLARMQNAAQRMRHMVEGLLELSRVATQGRPFERVELSEITAQALLDLDDQVQRSGGRVQVDPLPSVEGDPRQLRQLMQNLIGNALKYHPADRPPEVHVHAREHADAVEILVQDRGIGFEPELAERIFQPFQRLVGRSQYEGSGIGLSICRRIVERHGGIIQAASQPEQGATFIVSLPVRPPESICNE